MGSDIQSGPCVLCGATNYPLSYGGPTVCPTCDCQGPPREADQNELKRLRKIETAAKEYLDSIYGKRCSHFPYELARLVAPQRHLEQDEIPRPQTTFRRETVLDGSYEEEEE